MVDASESQMGELGLDFRNSLVRYTDAYRGLEFGGAVGSRVRSDLTRTRFERLGLTYPEFSYGLALVSDVDILRFELHAEELKNLRIPADERIARIVENLQRVEAANIEIIRTGILGVELTSQNGKARKIFREREAQTSLPASWQAMELILTREFPGIGFQPDLTGPKAPR